MNSIFSCSDIAFKKWLEMRFIGGRCAVLCSAVILTWRSWSRWCDRPVSQTTTFLTTRPALQTLVEPFRHIYLHRSPNLAPDCITHLAIIFDPTLYSIWLYHPFQFSKLGSASDQLPFLDYDKSHDYKKLKKLTFR